MSKTSTLMFGVSGFGDAKQKCNALRHHASVCKDEFCQVCLEINENAYESFANK